VTLPLHPRYQITLALNGVQHRIQRAGTEPVSVAAEFVDHPLPIDLVLRRVVENMEPDEPADQDRRISSVTAILIGSIID